MSDVHLITAKFATVNRLKEILQVRKISFTSSESIEQDNGISSQNVKH